MSNKRPNILLIMSDQHRADCTSIENHPAVLTPNLDNIAAQGVRFSRCYTTCPICVPARRSLISGQFPHTHKARSNIYKDWDIHYTLPGVLKDAGYHTYLVGRDMHQFPRRKRYGFDHMVTQYDYREWLDNRVPDITYPKDVSHHSSGYYTSGVMHNDWTARPWHLDENLHMTNWTVNEALKFLQKRDPACPFFLTVSFLAPHPPLIPPRFYMDRYLRQNLPDPVIGDWAEKPENEGKGVDVSNMSVNLKGEALKSSLAGYYGLINHIDDQIRRILNPVDGIYKMAGENTIVIYTSDHGEMLGDHYMWRKSFPYEGSARIPLYIKLPDRFGVKKGQVLDFPVCLEDIMPTILNLADCPVPDTVEGKSILPLMKGETNSINRPYIHIEQKNLHHSLTDGKIKYIFLLDKNKEQLFDLTTDPKEYRNLANNREYKEQMSYWRKKILEELYKQPDLYKQDIKRIKQKI